MLLGKPRSCTIFLWLQSGSRIINCAPKCLIRGISSCALGPNWEQRSEAKMPTILERIAEIEAEVKFKAATGYKTGRTFVVLYNPLL